MHCGPEGIPRRFDAVSLARHVRETGLAAPCSNRTWRPPRVGRRWLTTSPASASTARWCSTTTSAASIPRRCGARWVRPRTASPYLKVVWLPTVHAAAHLTARHHEGEQYDIPPEWCGGTVSALARPLAEVEPINVLAAHLRPPLDEILRIAADHDLVLATGHAGRDEVFYMMERANALGVRKVIVTHPCYDPPAIGVTELVELAAAGAYIELSFILVDMGLVSMADTAAIMRQVGSERTILSTDVGQVDRVAPAEGLAKLGAGLLRGGNSARGHRYRDEAQSPVPGGVPLTRATKPSPGTPAPGTPSESSWGCCGC